MQFKVSNKWLVSLVVIMIITIIFLTLLNFSKSTDPFKDEKVQATIDSLKDEVTELQALVDELKTENQLLEESYLAIEIQSETEEQELSVDKDGSGCLEVNYRGGIPLCRLGDKAIKDRIETTVSKITYTSDGFRVHFSVTNNSSSPMYSPGWFSFKLSESSYEKELNHLGYGWSSDTLGSYLSRRNRRWLL